MMKISCESCGTSFNIPDGKLPMGKKVVFPCPKCKEKIKLDLRTPEPEVEPPPEELTALSPLGGEKPPVGSEALKDKILRALKDLPAMPQVVIKAREIMNDADSGIKDVVKVLEKDQAITTKVLKVANSPYYGMSGKISTIQHASVVLGYKTIGELITLAAGSSLLNKPLKGYNLGSGDLWRHSLSVAIGSRILAARKYPELAGTCFSTGLIHDAGKLVLDKYIVERKEEFEEVMEYGQVSYMEAEDKIFGFNHAGLGFDVCKYWHIPEDMSFAIKYHHTPSKSDMNELAHIIYLADCMVNMSEAFSKMGSMGAGMEALMYMIDDRAMEFVGIQEADVKTIIDEINAGVGEMAGDL